MSTPVPSARLRLWAVLAMLMGAALTTYAIARAAQTKADPHWFHPEEVVAFRAVGPLGTIEMARLRSEYLLIAWGAFAVFLAGVGLACAARYRRVTDWLLVVMAVVVAALAANLVRIGILLPGAKLDLSPPLDLPMLPAARVGMMALVMLAVWLSRLGSAEPRVTLRQAGMFLFVAAQLALLVLVIQQYNVDSQIFCHEIITLVLAGFLIHCVLPVRLRLPFFLLLSLAAILGVFGLTDGVCLIGLGLVLIGICHLPAPLPVRVSLLVLAALFLGALRAKWLPVMWSDAIWPILGSMFMFRLIVYLYDLKHRKEPPTFTSTLSYFFLLPNVVFPLFPVVDYHTFRRTYQNEDPYRTYQTGLKWMVRGVTHLLLYRLVYYYLIIGAEDVTTVGDLVRYMVSNFLLILRLSGQFHLVIGMLHLFGFNLPEAMHRYWLAPSFTEFWRRANIYWKDFMQKVVFYPLCFRLRAWNMTSRLVFGTLVVFFITWFLHAYQWFWLRGSFLIAGPDVAFWVTFAVLVTVNTFLEAKHGRRRVLGRNSWSLRGMSATGLRTAGTFAVICVLWSLWISSSLSEWLSLWSVVRSPSSGFGRALPFCLVAAVVVGQAGQALKPEAGATPGQPSLLRSAITTSALIILLFAIGQPGVYAYFDARAEAVILDLQVDRLNKRDQVLLGRGYYENLARVDQFNSQLWERYNKAQEIWRPLFQTSAMARTGDFLGDTLQPGLNMTFKGAPLRTNRWGMRDKDYEKIPPPNTCRIALVGGSYEMGPGVDENQTFEAVLENRLNQELPGKPCGRYEILNFSVAGYCPLRRLVALETKAMSFAPTIIIYAAHPTDASKAYNHLAEKATAGVAVPYDELNEILRRADVKKDTVFRIAQTRLAPYSEEILGWAYQRIVEDCRQRGILPIFVLLPLIERDEPQELARHRALAREAGFLVLDLSDVFRGLDVDAVSLAPWDHHPSLMAHKLIANRLYQEILQQGDQVWTTSKNK